MLELDDLKYIAEVLQGAEETESKAYKKVSIMIEHKLAEKTFADKVAELRKQFNELESK